MMREMESNWEKDYTVISGEASLTQRRLVPIVLTVKGRRKMK